MSNKLDDFVTSWNNAAEELEIERELDQALADLPDFEEVICIDWNEKLISVGDIVRFGENKHEGEVIELRKDPQDENNGFVVVEIKDTINGKYRKDCFIYKYIVPAGQCTITQMYGGEA